MSTKPDGKNGIKVTYGCSGTAIFMQDILINADVYFFYRCATRSSHSVSVTVNTELRRNIAVYAVPRHLVALSSS